MSAVNPQHYQGFSNGAQPVDIAEHLSGNGAQALKYIARSTRIDGGNKGEVLQDLQKAKYFIEREIQRVGKDV
ncbi:DUF3310 domain-containing protein [Corynebacterium marquesiae]|uniref:DUF3310 domain-containing protein n=1 Tax=Corynebacterium marquesiae TaxID=2913503 RepID=UPI0038D21EF0